MWRQLHGKFLTGLWAVSLFSENLWWFWVHEKIGKFISEFPFHSIEALINWYIWSKRFSVSILRTRALSMHSSPFDERISDHRTGCRKLSCFKITQTTVIANLQIEFKNPKRSQKLSHVVDGEVSTKSPRSVGEYQKLFPSTTSSWVAASHEIIAVRLVEGADEERSVKSNLLTTWSVCVYHSDNCLCCESSLFFLLASRSSRRWAFGE